MPSWNSCLKPFQINNVLWKKCINEITKNMLNAGWKTYFNKFDKTLHKKATKLFYSKLVKA